MGLLSLEAFKTKWAALTGRFQDNVMFEVDEQDLREFSEDLADTMLEPVENLQTRVSKLESMEPSATELLNFWVEQPRISVNNATSFVSVTGGKASFDKVMTSYNPSGFPQSRPVAPLERIDSVYGHPGGALGIAQGVPSQNPATPVIPRGCLRVGDIHWNSEGGVIRNRLPILSSGSILQAFTYPKGNIRCADVATMLDLPENLTGGFYGVWDTDFDPSFAEARLTITQAISNETWQISRFWFSDTEWKFTAWEKLKGGEEITVDTALSSTSENPVQNKVIKSAIDALQVTGYETSYYFKGDLEVMDRFIEAVQFTSIEPGTLLSNVEIAVDGGIYQPLAVGFLVAAGKRFKLRITYATNMTEGVLITRVKKL